MRERGRVRNIRILPGARADAARTAFTGVERLLVDVRFGRIVFECHDGFYKMAALMESDGSAARHQGGNA